MHSAAMLMAVRPRPCCGWFKPSLVGPGPAVEARIQVVEPAQLERWLERILTANSPDGLFG